MNTNETRTFRFTWQALALWVGLTLLGFFLSIGFHFPTSFASPVLNPEDIDMSGAILGFVFGAVSGLIIASLQWLVLKAWFPRARLWVLPTAAGYGVVHAFGDAVPYMPLVLVGAGSRWGLPSSLPCARRCPNPSCGSQSQPSAGISISNWASPSIAHQGITRCFLHRLSMVVSRV